MIDNPMDLFSWGFVLDEALDLFEGWGFVAEVASIGQQGSNSTAASNPKVSRSRISLSFDSTDTR